ncbi:MAG: hypothetical protein WCK90_03570 [archaeon]
MTEQYQPTTLEVLARASREFFEPLRFIKNPVINFGKGLGIGAMRLMAVPSVIKGMREGKYSLDAPNRYGQITPNLVRYFGGFLGTVVSANLAMRASIANHSFKYILIPVATNLVSYAYERGRKHYADVKESIIRERRTQTNEDLVAKLEARK